MNSVAKLGDTNRVIYNKMDDLHPVFVYPIAVTSSPIIHAVLDMRTDMHQTVPDSLSNDNKIGLKNEFLCDLNKIFKALKAATGRYASENVEHFGFSNACVRIDIEFFECSRETKLEKHVWFIPS
jgi:hypothetical protein